jgi:hypothetical protein
LSRPIEEVTGRQTLRRDRNAPVLGMVTDACEVISTEEAGVLPRPAGPWWSWTAYVEMDRPWVIR